MIVNCDLFSSYIKEEGVKVSPLYKKAGFVELRLGTILRKLKINETYNICDELLNSKEDLIIFDSGITEPSILRYLAKTFRNKRLIFYYWNPVRFSISPLKIPKEFEVWSYSITDCEKYGLKYNSTFYFPNDFCNETSSNNQAISQDVFFIGKDKNRKKGLARIKSLFDNHHITYEFYITATHPRFQKKGYKKSISYKKSLEYVNSSNAILDYYFDPTAGLSLRAMESLFFKKKLITNNISIKRYDFYNKRNIFILDENNENDLVSFIADSFCDISEDIRKKYTFKEWLKRF